MGSATGRILLHVGRDARRVVGAVNLAHVAEIRRRDAEADWEVALEAPVNRVLPVSRSRIKRLWAAFGER